MTKRTIKLSGKIAKKADTEYSSELAQDTKKEFAKMDGKKGKFSERPANFEVYPGE